MTRITPRIALGRVVPPSVTDSVAKAFPGPGQVRANQIFGLHFEIMRIGDIATPMSGAFLCAGSDLETWSDVQLIDMNSETVDILAAPNQLRAYTRAREIDLGQAADYDPSWGRVSPDGIPVRGLTLIRDAQLLTEELDAAWYETSGEVRDRNLLYLVPADSAHARLGAQGNRAAAFALFTAFSQLHEVEDGPCTYASLDEGIAAAR